MTNIKRPWSVKQEGFGTVDSRHYYEIKDAEGNYIGRIEKEDIAAFIVAAVNTTTVKGD